MELNILAHLIKTPIMLLYLIHRPVIVYIIELF